MAKLVQLSDDAEVSWETLPGGSGEFSLDTGAIDDTVFGQTFQSNQPGLIGWNVNANGLYKGFAGYVATVKKQGTSTAMTAEACTLEAGKIYQIDATTKRIFDRTAAFVFKDGAVDKNAEIEWVDPLFGRFKFLDSYTVTGAVTVDGFFFPTVALGRARSFTLTQTAEAVDDTDFAIAQANSGHRTFIPGLRQAGLDLSSIYDIASGFRAALIARDELVVEINPDGNDKSFMRGFFKFSTEGQSGDVGALEEESINLVLNVPLPAALGINNILRPVGWFHAATTTLSEAIQIALTAWETETEIDVQYLYDGVNGVKGACIVTDVTLSGGLEVMNDFACNVQGVGVTADVGTG